MSIALHAFDSRHDFHRGDVVARTICFQLQAWMHVLRTSGLTPAGSSALKQGGQARVAWCHVINFH